LTHTQPPFLSFSNHTQTQTQTQILMERPGDIVVHVKFTVLLLPSGTVKITGLPFPTDAIHSDKASTGQDRTGQSSRVESSRVRGTPTKAFFFYGGGGEREGGLR
jgi:hypothetical protein